MSDTGHFKQLDHIAVIVRDTDEALKFYRDVLRLPIVLSETLEDVGVKLTHLEMGGVHLQLVQPLCADHPLHEHLILHGEGLHHLCFLVPDVARAVAELPGLGLAQRGKSLHRGPRGRKAAFVDPACTRGVLIELTG